MLVPNQVPSVILSETSAHGISTKALRVGFALLHLNLYGNMLANMFREVCLLGDCKSSQIDN